MAQPPRDLQSLLAWSTSQTSANGAAPAAAPPQSTQRLDPGILDAILGRTDAVRMRECMDTVNAVKERSRDERMAAWDELEMILESLDNANDLQPLGLWPQIIAHLTSDEDESVVQALWVCGTAINNNPKARDDVSTKQCYVMLLVLTRSQFLRQEALPTLVSLPRATSANAEVRSKALYCLGGVLKHNVDSLARFGELDGWAALEDALRDPILACRRKAAFLIGTLLVDDDTAAAARDAALHKAAVVPALVASLSPSTAQPTGPNGDGDGFDEDVAESAVRALRALGASLTAVDRRDVARALAEGHTDFGLTPGEKVDFARTLQA